MTKNEAQRPASRAVTAEDLFRFRFLMGADLAPNGRSVVCALSRTSIEANMDLIDLFLLDVESGERTQLMDGNAISWAPAFSPDGRSIAFLSTLKGMPQVFVMPATGGEPRQVTAMPFGVGGGPAWSPDSSRIAFTAGPSHPPRDPSKPYRVKRTIWRADGIGVIEDALQDIYVIAAAGGDPQRITNDAFMNVNPMWSADGNSIIYTAALDPDLQYSVGSRLRRVDLNAGITDLAHAGMLAYATCADGRIVYMNGFEPGKLSGTKNDLWVLDPATGVSERRTVGLDVGIGGIIQPDMPTYAAVMGKLLVSKDGAHAYASVQRGGEIAIFKIALSGAESYEPVLQGQRVCAAWGLHGDSLLFSSTNISEPGDLYLANTAARTERRLTQLNADVLAELKLPTMRRLEYRSSDGRSIEGWYLPPVDGEAPYPTILAIHGGPHAGWGYAFNFDFLMFTGAGFGVLFVNQRGSTGYGSEFANLKFDGSHLDYDDLMAGVDHAIELGLADADRLGVCGVSAGGMLTGWIIGHTDRFKAACPENPLFNLFSYYGTSDAGTWADQMGAGKPYERREVYEQYSPISSAHRCTTPTLFLQHENDFRCPAEQTEQYYTILKVRGVTAEMLRFPGTGHHGSLIGPVSHRRAQNEAMLEWMSRYVLGKK